MYFISMFRILENLLFLCQHALHVYTFKISNKDITIHERKLAVLL